MFEIRTTCRPATDFNAFLESNLIVRQAIACEFPIRVFNRESEVPAELDEYDNVTLDAAFSGKRPKLGEMLNNISCEKILLCNADVFFERNLAEKLQALPENAVLGISGRRFDVDASLRDHDNFSAEKLRKLGFRQTKRTLDYFIFSRNIAETLLANGSVAEQVPGTVGFDIHLISTFNSHGVGCDASEYISIFHPNHEDFRAVYRSGILLNLTGNKTFSEARASQTSMLKFDAPQGALNYCPFALTPDGVLKTNKFRGRKSYLLSRIFDVASNRFERFCFRANLALYRFFSRRPKIFVLSRRLKIVLLLPIGARCVDADFSEVVQGKISDLLKV